MKCTLAGMILGGLLAMAASSAVAAPPNILFAIADDWGAHAGAYGTPWVKTPAFDRVARTGLLFNRAYTPNAKCAPSRACILTGRNSWQLEAAANHICYFPPKFKGWGEALAEHGWFVGHTLKGWGPGVALDTNGAPRLMTGKAFNKRTATPPTRGISANDYAANFADFLDAAPSNQPWCFWYGAVEPHRDYEFGSGVAKGGKQTSEVDHVPACWPDNEDVRNDLLDYAFEVEHFDRHLGRMLNELEKRGLLSNTIVVVTSDHGMPFPRAKGGTGELSNHVPLAMQWPGGITGTNRVIEDFVSFVDIAPTFVELAGLPWSETGMEATAGKSLAEYFGTDRAGRVVPERDHVLIGKERNDIGRPHDWGYPTRGIVTHDWLLLEHFEPARWPAGNPETGYLDCDAGKTKSVILDARRAKGRDPFWDLCFGKRPAVELYDLRADPEAVKNLTGASETAEREQALLTQMHAELKRQGDPRMEGGGAVFDEYPHANKGNVNFYERFKAGEKMKTGWVDDSDYEKKPLD